MPCDAAWFRELPRMDLVGAPVGGEYGVNLLSSSPASSEVLCRQACCVAGASCTAYAFSIVSTLTNCFLYANVTNLVPSTTMRSAVLRSAYS